MPGTNYSYEKGLLFELHPKYRDLAQNFLWQKELGEFIHIHSNVTEDSVQRKYEIDDPSEWQKMMKALILTKITYFDLSLCNATQINFLLETANSVIFEDIYSPKNLSASFQNQYPVLMEWLVQANENLVNARTA